MSDTEPTKNSEQKIFETSLQDISLQFDELNYGELEQSLDIPVFEFSSPISSISNCSSPDRTAIPHTDLEEEEMDVDNSNDFVSLEELNSQISPPSEDDHSTITVMRTLETIFEDVYLETPPGSPSTTQNMHKRKRRMVRMDLSKCDEFKENVHTNTLTNT